MKPRPLAVDPKSFERSGVPWIAKRHRLPLREGPNGLEGEPMHEWQNLSHVRWDCKYHIVIIPKYRRKVFYGRLRRQIGVILRELCRQRAIDLVEGACDARPHPPVPEHPAEV